MNKKIGLLYSLVLIMSSAFTSCGNSDDDLLGNWVVAQNDFAGKARGYATSFVVGNKLYIFGGFNGKDNLNDLWALDTSTDNGSWTQLAPLEASTATIANPATVHFGRKHAVSFAIGTDGYVGTGYDDKDNMKDFWKYDTKANRWTQIADFPGDARYGSYAFALKGNGYVGGGRNEDGFYNDYYSYNPTTGKWSTEVATVGKKRAYASTFIINDVAYLFGGFNSSGVPTDMSAFDGTKWTSKRAIANEKDDSFDDSYTTIARYFASTFVVNGKGYVTCGQNGSFLKNTWEYDPATDLWRERTSFERSTIRSGAIGATINGKGAVLTGSFSSSSYLDDVNLFYPTDPYNKND